jgi:hypothetical protein
VATLHTHANSRCAHHPDAHATFACTRCGAFCCPSCLARELGPPGICVPCAAKIRRPTWKVPLEVPKTSGVGGFVRTAGQLAFRPFSSLRGLEPHHNAVWTPYWFALICEIVRTSARTVIPVLGIEGTARASGSSLLQRVSIVAACVGGLLIFVGVWTLIRVLILAAGEHFLMWILDSASGGIEATLRVSGYTHVVSLLGAVPALWWAAEAWQALLRLLGYRWVHENRGARTAVTFFAVALLALAYVLPQYFLDSMVAAGFHGAVSGIERRIMEP